MAHPPPDPSDFDKLPDHTLVNRKFAETILDLSHGTLANWKCEGRNELREINVGKNCRLQIGELRSYLSRTSGMSPFFSMIVVNSSDRTIRSDLDEIQEWYSFLKLDAVKTGKQTLAPMTKCAGNLTASISGDSIYYRYNSEGMELTHSERIRL